MTFCVSQGQGIRLQPDHRRPVPADVRDDQSVPERPERAGPEQHLLRVGGVELRRARVPVQEHAGDRKQDPVGDRGILRDRKQKGSVRVAVVAVAVTAACEVGVVYAPRRHPPVTTFRDGTVRA